jgi:hypothetical protein
MQDARRITLKDAIERYRSTLIANHVIPYSNSTEWYRKQLHRRGSCFLGGGQNRVPGIKTPRGWTLALADVDAAIQGTLAEAARHEAATDDYERHVLWDSGIVQTQWGHYSRRGDFHFAVNTQDAILHRSSGGWFCSLCFKPATTERNAPECNVCEKGWRTCHNDCRLSAVACLPCGTTLRIRDASKA